MPRLWRAVDFEAAPHRVLITAPPAKRALRGIPIQKANRMIRMAIAFTVCLFLEAAAFGFDVGETVIVIRETEVRVENRAVDRLSLGMELQIGAIHGNWLWVSRGHPGWVDSQHVVGLGQAIPVLTEMIRQRPDQASLYNGRGLVWHAQKSYDRAIADFDEAIRLSPQAAWYGHRGVTRFETGDYDLAILDFDEAIRRSPHHAHHTWYNHRGNTLKAKGDYDQAIADYNEAIRLNPKYVATYNQLAWLWATCPDKRFRNGPKAVQYATKACDMGAWKIADNLDTLAASCAETGNFSDAVKWQQKAIELALPGERTEMQSRLELYHHARPYREDSAK